jgi:hypothetical protein
VPLHPWVQGREIVVGSIVRATNFKDQLQSSKAFARMIREGHPNRFTVRTIRKAGNAIPKSEDILTLKEVIEYIGHNRGHGYWRKRFELIE